MKNIKYVLQYAILYLLAIALGIALAQAQVATQSSTGLSAPMLNGVGIPSTNITCNAWSQNVPYVQTDAPAGSRLWICENISGTFAWENLKGPVATAVTGNMSAALLGLAGCTSTTVTINGLVVGVNSAVAAPIGMPTSTAATAGQINVNAYVSAANTVTVSVCAVATLTTAAIPYKVLAY